MARRKVLFVIVEGPSDEDALGTFFHRIYDQDTVFVQVVRGDITSMTGRIKDRIADAIRGYASLNSLKKDDFKGIIHIVDMDGAYIPPEMVIDDPTVQGTFYSTKEIRSANRAGILARNELKSKNLDIISSMSTAWGGVPYQAYYMSCNLDHVLYDKLNTSDDEKEKNSLDFVRQYKENITGFIEFICDSSFSVGGNYQDTWRYIKPEGRSLERHTNLGLCLKPYRADRNN